MSSILVIAAAGLGPPLPIGAVTGAIAYGSLTRLFWLGKFPAKRVLAIALICVLASWLAFFVRGYLDLGGWWLAAAWWFAFSAGLWFFDTRPDALTRPTYNSR